MLIRLSFIILCIQVCRREDFGWLPGDQCALLSSKLGVMYTFTLYRMSSDIAAVSLPTHTPPLIQALIIVLLNLVLPRWRERTLQGWTQLVV